jgi:hypothetical protein
MFPSIKRPGLVRYTCPASQQGESGLASVALSKPHTMADCNHGVIVRLQPGVALVGTAGAMLCMVCGLVLFGCWLSRNT